VKWQDVEKNGSCLRFWKNDPLWGNLQNYVLKGFIASPIDVLCSNFVKFGRRQISNVVRYLPHKISPGSPALAPKICQGQPPTMYSECFRYNPNRFTLSRVIFERVNTVRACSKVNTMFGWSLALSRITS